VVPHIHHTLTLGRSISGRLKPLPELHGLGLMPHVKEIWVKQLHGGPWFTPLVLGCRNLRHFSAFRNVHTLRLQRLEIHRLMPCIERYFKQFFPTLRSVMLFEPCCTARQLSHFLSYFPNLDDIEIRRVLGTPGSTDPGTRVAQFSAPKLRGQLALCDFPWVDTWTHLITSCGGLRFRYMDQAV